MPRVIAWFSCGAASAVAAKKAVEKYGAECEVVYCNTMATEHSDNKRFFDDIQTWLGKEISTITSEKYHTVDDVFEREKYMAGIAGARCTTEMKKVPRFVYQEADDTHIFGFTWDERNRMHNFEYNNPDLKTEWILYNLGIDKEHCYAILKAAGIELPVMYSLGYKNNNCLGCVKATSPLYWNMTRRDFPDVFERRVKQSRELGVRLVKLKGKRIFLDELPGDYMPAEELENLSCGPECGDTTIGGT